MVKIQKQVAWKRGKEIYYKWVVILPEETVKNAGIKAGETLVPMSHGKGTKRITLIGIKEFKEKVIEKLPEEELKRIKDRFPLYSDDEGTIFRKNKYKKVI